MRKMGYKNINFKRLAAVYKKAGVKSNLIICVDKAIFSTNNSEDVTSVIWDFADYAANVEEDRQSVIIYSNRIKFYPDFDDVSELVNLSSKVYPDLLFVITLAEGESLDEAESFGNRSDLLPNNWQELLTDSLNPKEDTGLFPDDKEDLGTGQFEDYYSKDLPRWIE